MGIKKFSISLPDWLFLDLEIANSRNRSARIQELLIKGYMSEQRKMITLGKPLNKEVKTEELGFPANLSGVSFKCIFSDCDDYSQDFSSNSVIFSDFAEIEL